jgi:hypothetical protein
VNSLELDPELAAARALPGWAAVKARAAENLKHAKTPPLPVPVLAAIDVYGSRRVDPELVRRALGFEVGRPFVRSAVLLRQKEAEIKKLHAFAFVKVSYINYLGGPEAGRCYLTVDLVDAGDEQRVRFLPEPTEQPPDPEGLVARWRAPAHLDELAATLRRDKDPKNRAAAAFLLAYANEPAQAVERLTPSIRDPASLVRNNVLRVLGALQKSADRPLLDLAKVVDAVGLPETTDRNKALYVLMGLLEKTPPKDRAAQRGAIVRQAGAALVAMASLRQPNNRDHARGVLELLSGEKHEDPIPPGHGSDALAKARRESVLDGVRRLAGVQPVADLRAQRPYEIRIVDIERLCPATWGQDSAQEPRLACCRAAPHCLRARGRRSRRARCEDAARREHGERDRRCPRAPHDAPLQRSVSSSFWNRASFRRLSRSESLSMCSLCLKPASMDCFR